VAGDVFIDTNVIVYAAEGTDASRSAVAERILERLRASGRGVVSQQVLAEFARVATERIPSPLTADAAVQWVRGIAESFRVLEVTPAVIAEALHVKERNQVSYWDAQVLAAARLNLVGTLLTEDLADGIDYEGVRVVNPFAPGFDLDRLQELESR
jgi:predicted nucleic acid-binding protein